MLICVFAIILFNGGNVNGGCVSSFDPDVVRLIEEAFNIAKSAVQQDQDQRTLFLNKGADTHDVNSVDGQLDLFTFEDNQAHRMSDEGMVYTEALKYLQQKKITLSELKSKYNKEWLMITAKYPLTKPVVDCDLSYPYRTADGSCNNEKHVLWGKSDTLQPRFLDPDYDDGIDAPRVKSVNGGELPSARKVSNLLMKCDQVQKSDRNTVMVMAWGQFLDHDLVATPVSKGKNGASIKCCGIEEIRPECFPIQIPKDDPYFQTDCLNFVRSAETVKPDSSPTPREQINQVTSYIDASVVYGSTKDMMDKLRLFVNGQLKTSKHGLFPPQSNDTCRLTHGNEFCMFAGDFRVNVVPNLSILHLIFLREHNRIAKKLATLNPTWDDEKTFQETRKIIAALIQQISYLEYLTGVLGYKTISNYNLNIASTGFSNVYDQSVDPSIRNAFAAAAFRFGHAQITSSVLYYKHDHSVKNYNVEETYHNPHLVQNDNSQHKPDLGRWVANNASIKADRCFVSSVRDKLFIDKKNNSLDLAALNIQRGRDHGIPPYVKWRSLCGLSEVSSFDSGDGKLVDHDTDAISKLKMAYAHVDDIDLYAGGISEKHLQGADVGPTFACILSRQFQALKEGDRFWYENKFKKSGFSSDQLKEIKKMRLSKLMCENLNIEAIQENVFIMPNDRSNKLKRCQDLPDIDFKYWQEQGQ